MSLNKRQRVGCFLLVLLAAPGARAAQTKKEKQVKDPAAECLAQYLERVKATGKFEDEGGITSIQVISTSHLSLHAWPLQSFFSLDSFSCKDFDAEVALDIIREEMGVIAESTHVIPRFKPDLAVLPTVFRGSEVVRASV